jgi:AraC-like DNA-binding protein
MVGGRAGWSWIEHWVDVAHGVQLVSARLPPRRLPRALCPYYTPIHLGPSDHSVCALVPEITIRAVWRSLTTRDEPPPFPELLDDACLAARHPARLLGDADRCVLEAETTSWLEAVVAWAGSRPAPPRRRAVGAVRVAQEILQQRPAERISLRELADAAGVSRWHLVRAFRDAVGMPPHRYHMALRLWSALERIRRGSPLSDVAHLCGFADQSHLALRFQRQYGMSPGAFVALAASGSHHSRHA